MPAITRERPGAGIELIRIDRPDVRNALDTETTLALVDAFSEAASDDSLHALVLSTTSTRAFCAGADITEELDAEGGVRRMEAYTEMYRSLDEIPVPVVCVCVGNCVGAGAELAAGSDLRIAGDNLKLAWAGSRLGVPVGPARLISLIGLARAKELVYTGRVIDGEEALALGLAHRLATAAEAEPAAIELAGDLAGRPVEGLRRLKRMFREFDGSADRVAHENELLIEFERGGGGLPRGDSGS